MIPVSLWLAHSAYGLPHLRWSYTYLDNGRPYDPFVPRYYTRCSYAGPYGDVTVRPADGQCPVIRFFKPRPAP
ncbi:MAG: hypothetical protein AAFW98_19600 [Pseudomonadota bacterium]